jgi:hypothetical protein
MIYESANYKTESRSLGDGSWGPIHLLGSPNVLADASERGYARKRERRELMQVCASLLGPATLKPQTNGRSEPRIMTHSTIINP